MKRLAFAVLVAALVVGVAVSAQKAPTYSGPMIGINVLLNQEVSPAALGQLGAFGKVRDVIYEIRAVTMQAREGALPAIQALPFVEAAGPDAERQGRPVDTVPVTDFANGVNTWNLDAVNVTNPQPGANRVVGHDGAGVYVAVLDTGLLDSWRQYFPQERIAEEYAKSFSGGGAQDAGAVPEQPNKWEHDQNSHGTHVTSTILGYTFGTILINGVAPMATVIPVKVLNQNGSGWSSVIARGIMYVAQLKEGPLAAHPVVINMSLAGSRLDPVEQAAIDYAIARGVIIVAAAANYGTRGMGYPGAYAPVISVAASGWVSEWVGGGSWWWANDVADPTNPDHFYITDFSSREAPGQDLDVAAPGSWVVGPYQINSGQLSYYYLGGTSMASPHVAGIVALMLQKNSALTAAQAETILEGSAIYLAPGCRDLPATGEHFCWEANATGAGLATADAALAATP